MKNQSIWLIIMSICLSASFYVGANQGGESTWFSI